MQQDASWFANFMSDYVIFVYKIMGFLFYASGHLLLAAAALSFVRNSEWFMQTIVEGTLLLGLVYGFLLMLGVGLIAGLFAAGVHTACLYVPFLVRAVDAVQLYGLRVGMQWRLFLDVVADRFDVRSLISEHWYVQNSHVLRIRQTMSWPNSDITALETASPTVE